MLKVLCMDIRNNYGLLSSVEHFHFPFYQREIQLAFSHLTCQAAGFGSMLWKVPSRRAWALSGTGDAVL